MEMLSQLKTAPEPGNRVGYWFAPEAGAEVLEVMKTNFTLELGPPVIWTHWIKLAVNSPSGFTWVPYRPPEEP